MVREGERYERSEVQHCNAVSPLQRAHNTVRRGKHAGGYDLYCTDYVDVPSPLINLYCGPYTYTELRDSRIYGGGSDSRAKGIDRIYK